MADLFEMLVPPEKRAEYRRENAEYKRERIKQELQHRHRTMDYNDASKGVIFEVTYWRHGEGHGYASDKADDALEMYGILEGLHWQEKEALKTLARCPSFRRIDFGDNDLGYTFKRVDPDYDELEAPDTSTEGT